VSGDTGAVRARHGGLPRARMLAGLGLAVVGLPALTLGLVPARHALSLASLLLLYLLVVVLVAVVGGTAVAVLAAVGSFGLANWYLTPPYHTFRIEQRDAVIALLVFVLVACVVSVTVELAARGRAAATRDRMEVELLSRVTSGPPDTGAEAVLEQIRAGFALTSVRLYESGRDEPVAAVGPTVADQPALSVPAGPRFRLVAAGPPTFAADQRLLRSLAAAAGRAAERERLAAQADKLAEIDRLRAALLAAVGHDLRTPLAGIKAAVSSLRQGDVDWSPADTADFLATIEDSADQLDELVANLLDMSRLQAGVLSVNLVPVSLAEVVARVLLRSPAGPLLVDVPEDLPLVAADPGLLERVLANLVGNASRYAPGPARIEAAPTEGERVRLSVIDTGPGIDAADRERVFAPFQRLDDRRTGIGLGLAIARGFCTAMGGTLEPSDTPGGGLTMTLTLPAAAAL
jgi:two-component system, OmpR family, sensor histidine kinase KdpD